MVEESKQKWLAVMVNDLMSSEESGEDDTVTVPYQNLCQICCSEVTTMMYMATS